MSQKPEGARDTVCWEHAQYTLADMQETISLLVHTNCELYLLLLLAMAIHVNVWVLEVECMNHFTVSSSIRQTTVDNDDGYGGDHGIWHDNMRLYL